MSNMTTYAILNENGIEIGCGDPLTRRREAEASAKRRVAAVGGAYLIQRDGQTVSIVSRDWVTGRVTVGRLA